MVGVMKAMLKAGAEAYLATCDVRTTDNPAGELVEAPPGWRPSVSFSWLRDSASFVGKESARLFKELTPNLSTREKVVCAAAAGYGCYKVYEHREKAVDVWMAIKKRLGYDVRERFRAMTVDEKSVVYECLRPGSNEVDLLKPNCQCSVGELVGTEFVLSGSAVLMGTDEHNYLVMPEHVWVSTKRVWAKGRQHRVELTGKRGTPDEVPIANDLVAIAITSKEMSVIGISKMSVCHHVPEYGSEAKIVGVQGKGTTGVLKHDCSVFGKMTYNGTTMPGYSGSAYMVNNQIAGVHTQGSKLVNGGYSASFIWMILGHHIRKNLKDMTVLEETHDWLMSLHKKKKNVRVDKQYYDIDEIRIQVDGKYSIVSRDDMSRAFGRDWADELSAVGVLSVPSQRSYSDVALESLMTGESNSLENLGASSLLEDARELEKSLRRNITRELLSLSKTQFQDLKKSAQRSGICPEPSSFGQTQQATQPQSTSL